MLPETGEPQREWRMAHEGPVRLRWLEANMGTKGFRADVPTRPSFGLSASVVFGTQSRLAGHGRYRPGEGATGRGLPSPFPRFGCEMRVRAKIKAWDALPEWARCCEKKRKEHHAFTTDAFEVDLSDTRSAGIGHCRFCRAEQPVMVDVTAYVDGVDYWIGIEVLDLDEGPMIP